MLVCVELVVIAAEEERVLVAVLFAVPLLVVDTVLVCVEPLEGVPVELVVGVPDCVEEGVTEAVEEDVPDWVDEAVPVWV